MALPATESPLPAGQVRHAAHVPWPAVEVNVPAAHGLHSRSDVSDGALDSHEPAAQGAASVVHERPYMPSSAVEKLAPSMQASHRRSAVAEPAALTPSPAAQVRQALHAPLPTAALKWPSAQGLHTRSLLIVDSAVENVPVAHVVMSVHWRSDVPVGAFDVYCVAEHALCVAHTRLDEAVGLAVSYSPTLHVVVIAHAVPSFVDENVPDAHGVHTRSAVAEPASS